MTATFGVADYVVFAVTILASIAIGMFFAFTGKKQSTNREYLVGDRKMKLIPVAVSLLVSYLSTIGILGNPAEVYAYGTQFMFYIVAVVIGVSVGTFVFVPLYYPLKITSVYEYHRMRFRMKYVEYFNIFLAVVVMVLFNGVLIFSPCLAFETVSGFPTWASILISGVATILYTTLGGMKAVVWTDVFQAVIIFVGLITLVTKATIDVGGIAEVWKINNEWGRVQFFEFSVDPTVRLTFWTVVVFNSVLWMTVVSAQPSVQRFMALSSIKKAKLSTLFIVPGMMTSGLLTCSCGVTAFAYYAKKGCDPLWSGQIRGPNEIIPRLVMDVLTIPSLPGLFIACLFSASISSVSSAYNALGAVLWENVLQQKYGHLSDREQANITKITTASFGVLCIATSFLFNYIGGTLIQVTYSVIGGIGGPMIGTIFVGGLFPRIGPKSIMIGTVLSLSFCIWISVGATFTGVYTPPLPGPTYNCVFTGPDGMYTGNDSTPAMYKLPTEGVATESIAKLTPKTQKSGVLWLYSISYFYYPTIGVFITVVVSLLCSLIPGFDVMPKVPKKLLFPCIRRCCGAPDPEDSLDIKPTLINQEMEPMKHPGSDNLNSEENDLWIRRDDVTKPLKHSEEAVFIKSI